MRMWIGALAVLIGSNSAAEPLIYTGHSVTFSKQSFADQTDPANQDLIVNGVAITRGSTAGLFNAAVEQSFTNNTSPAGTRWAFKNNNGGQEPGASDWASLTFDDWQTALGGQGGLATNILDGGAVVHLVDQDIYLDIRFTAWGLGSGAGGSFTYDRSEIAPSADFDRDGDVDGLDFLTWQRGFGVAAPMQFSGDANFDGAIDASDLEVWQASFGNPLLGEIAIPEPAAWLLVAATAVLCGFRRVICSR